MTLFLPLAGLCVGGALVALGILLCVAWRTR